MGDERQDLDHVSRRGVLVRGGLVAGAAWIAPQIIGVPAAAASTCMDESLTWSVDPGSGAVPSGTTVALSPTTDVTFQFADPTSAVTTSAVDNIFPRPADTYHMQLGTSGAGPVTLELVFSEPVTDVGFSVLDVDISGSAGGWRDEVEVQAQLGAGAFFDGVGTPGPAVGTIVANRTYRGNVPAANNGTDGDIAFVFAGPLDRVRIIYRRAGATLSQGTGLSNLTACV